jgi:hypothetical protein
MGKIVCFLTRIKQQKYRLVPSIKELLYFCFEVIVVVG